MRWMAVAAVASVCVCLLAHGGGWVGKQAPEIHVRKWLNTKKGYSLAECRGKVVLLDFWATWCPPCRRAMPHLQKLWEKHKDKGLVVIGLTAESESKAAPFIKRAGYTFPVALDDRRKTSKAYGIRWIPHTFLIGADGKIIWDGNPLVAKDKLDKMVEDALKKALPDMPEEEILATPFNLKLNAADYKGMLKQAANSAANGHYSSAIRTLQRLLEKKKVEESEKQAASGMLSRIGQHGRLLLEKGKLLLKRREFAEAYDWLRRISRAFGKYDPGPQAKKFLKDNFKGEKILNEVAADRLLTKAKELLNKGKEEEAEKVIEKIKSRYPETAAAKKVEQLLKKK